MNPKDDIRCLQVYAPLADNFECNLILCAARPPRVHKHCCNHPQGWSMSRHIRPSIHLDSVCFFETSVEKDSILKANSRALPPLSPPLQPTNIGGFATPSSL